MISQIKQYQHFVAVLDNFGSKVPVVYDDLSAHEQLYPTTSLDENSIEFQFQTDCAFFIDLRESYLPWQLTLCAHRIFIPIKFDELSPETKDFCFAKVMNTKRILMMSKKPRCLIRFSREKLKCLAYLMDICCTVNCEITFSQPRNCYTQT